MLRTALIVAAALVALTLARAAGEAEAGGGCRGMPVTDANGTSVTMEGSCFTPTTIRIQPGETVTWVNPGLEPHTVTGANAAWGDYNDVLEGQSVTQRFTDVGVYPYYCALHPGMIGTVVVGDGSPSLVAAGGGRVAVEEVERGGPAQAVEASGGDDDSNIWVAAGVVAVVAIVAAGVAYTTGWRLATRR